MVLVQINSVVKVIIGNSNFDAEEENGRQKAVIVSNNNDDSDIGLTLKSVLN